MNLTDLARLLGVSVNQVHMWHKRRHTTGFPEPFAYTIYNPKGGRKKAPLFNPEDVVSWYRSYDPNTRRGEHWARKRAQTA